MSSVIKSAPYHLQVYEIIKEKILSGELTTGERIYENKISQELGVSRSPVREALRMLEQDEFLVLTSAGLTVNPMEPEDMEEIYQCRIAIEPFAARYAVMRLTDDSLEALQRFVDQARECHGRSEFNKVIEINTCFHDCIIRNCGNSRLQNILERISSLALLSRVSEFQCYQRKDDYLKEHQAVIDAFKARDEDLVETTFRDHIRNDLKFYQQKYYEKVKADEISD